MKRIASIFTLVILSLCIITSCKKDDASPSKTELLTAKSWSMTKFEVTYGGVTTDATDGFIEDCDKDDLVSFTKDGTYSFNTGTDDCDGDSPSEKGTWVLKTNETILSITTSSDVEDLTLVSINSTTLKVSVQTSYDINQDGKDDLITEILTFTAK